MLVEFAADIFRRLQSDFDKAKVVQLIQKTMSHVQTSPQQAPQIRINNVLQIRNEIDQCALRLDPLLQADAVTRAFKDWYVLERFPRSILSKLRGMITQDGRLLTTSAELEHLLNFTVETIQFLGGFAGTANALRLDEVIVGTEEGSVSALYSLPESAAASDIGNLIEISKEFEDFSAVITEYYLGDKRIPKLSHLSMSSLSYFFTYKDEIILTLTVWGELMKAAKASIEALIAARVFLDFDRRATETLLEGQNKAIMTKLNQALEKISVIERDAARRTELHPRVILVSEVMMRRIMEGARFEILGGNGFDALEVPPLEGEETTISSTQLLEQHRTLQLTLPTIEEPAALIAHDPIDPPS